MSIEKIALYKERIEAAIAELDLPKSPAELYEPFAYIMSLGGKRFRPIFTLTGCALFGEDPYKAMPQALAIEIFHNFSLVHDDIMDGAPIRRGKDTVHEKWDLNIALLSGDCMLVYAYEYLMQCDPKLLRPLMEAFNRSAIDVCEGQQYDMNFEKRDSVSMEEYLRMISLKTAALSGASLKVGALVGNASAEEAELLRQFGINLGIAFQIQDDYLDVFADPDKFGKRVGGDIVSNKKTWLMIQALEQAGPDSALAGWIAKTDFDETEKVQAVSAIYKELGVDQQALQATDEYYQKAMSSLEQIAVPAEQKAPLIGMAEWLMNRDH